MSGFREMRRKRQQLSREESVAILQKSTSGTLALLGDDGYPYAVPMSYVYNEGKLYFHSALTGHKIDAIRKCDKASFCVIEQDDVQPEKYTTFFRSVNHRISNRCYCMNQMTQFRQGEQPNSATPRSQEIHVCATLLLTTVIILVICLLDFFLCLSCLASLRSGISWLITLSSLYSRVPDT